MPASKSSNALIAAWLAAFNTDCTFAEGVIPAKISKSVSYAWTSVPMVRPRIPMAVEVEDRSERLLSAAIKVVDANPGNVTNVVSEMFGVRNSV